jgi:carboxyl-terminal processing protease
MIADGHLTATPVSGDSAAYASGLRGGDEILAVNGVAVKTMSVIAFKWSLRGEPGSGIILTVLHKDAGEPVDLHLKRVEVPDYEPVTSTLID